MRAHCAILFAACLVFASCAKVGPRCYEVTGTVTFDGQPVPAGRIYFEPDPKKGNDGPQGFAVIDNGHYDTREGGRGSVGGPVLVHIEGFDGQSADPALPGDPLFVPQDLKAELPNQDSTKDFEIPASAAKSLSHVKALRP